MDEEEGDDGASITVTDAGTVLLTPFRQTLFNDCPGGACALVQHHSTTLLCVIVAVGVVFLLTLIPPVFSWSRCKPDGRRRAFFAFLACVAFYFWLAFLIFNSAYCFGFLAHQGPCRDVNRTANAIVKEGTAASTSTTTQATALETSQSLLDEEERQEDSGFIAERQPLVLALSSAKDDSCEEELTPHESDLRNLTAVNVLIIVVLIIVLVANANEALNAKALHYNETLCKTEDVQKFLCGLVSKPPEVGHYVTCFHDAKADSSTSGGGGGGASAGGGGNKTSGGSTAPRQVVTYSAVENFTFASWRDFSDLRLVDPSPAFPIIEVEVALNFFPGDHFTAERYKAFVVQVTKTHSGRDAKINIDDYFHIEDQREWTFFVGDPNLVSPWWSKGAARIILSCIFLFGWPLRMNYHGKIAKHRVEVKKAVFCENTSQDEGVSLSATPGSGSNETGQPQQQKEEKLAEEEVEASAVSVGENSSKNHDDSRKSEEDNIEEEEEATNDEDVDGKRPPAGSSHKATSPLASATPTALAAMLPADDITMSSASTKAVVRKVAGHNPGNVDVPLHLDVMGGSRRQNEQLVNAVISNPPPSSHHYQQQRVLYQQQQPQQQPPQQPPPLYSSVPLQATASSSAASSTPPVMMHHHHHAQQRLSSPRTHVRESTNNMVTAVTHQKDVNGISGAVNTIALKDIDVQMSALSGYETYV